MDSFQVTRSGHITTVTLTRPASLNALRSSDHFALSQVWDEFSRDPLQRVAILTGVGDAAFCAGFDLKSNQAAGYSLPATGFCGLTSRFDMNKPVIAAINGMAIGGGFETVLACDLAISADHATFALPEPRHGLAALAGGIHRLMRQLPSKQAMEILLTGRPIRADRALAMGVLNQVVPSTEVMAAATLMAESIIECSPASIRATKEVAGRTLETPGLAAAMANHFPAVDTMRSGPDYTEGPLAFREKRRPVWSDQASGE